MELVRNRVSVQYQIKSYQPGKIQVNKGWYSHPIIVLPDAFITPWQVPSWEGLLAEHFEDLKQYKPHLLLLGSGSKPPFLHRNIAEALQMPSMGFEVMSSASACKTYSILSSEGKHVAVALFP